MHLILSWELIRRWCTVKNVSLGILGCLCLFLIIPPNTNALRDTSTVILDSNQEMLHVTLNKTEKYRIPISLKDVDAKYLSMLIAREDKRFFSHPGVDPIALARAAVQFFRHRSIISGGSTLTMQVVRLLNPRPRTLLAKGIEILGAMRLECHLTKNQILEAYLTLAPMGSNVEGITAGTYRYFQKAPTQLSLDEAAFLVALPQSPNRLSKPKYHMRLTSSRDRVLKIAQTAGIISSRESSEYQRSNLPALLYSFPKWSFHIAQREKGIVATTLVRSLQTKIEPFLAQKTDSHDPKQNAAALVVDSRNGSVLAYVGSAHPYDFNRFGFIDMIRSIRSPGSILKPFVYAIAFDEGWLQPGTIIRDESINIKGYRPQNFDNNTQGDVTISEALQQSLNIPAVKVFNRLGTETFLEKFKQAGISLVLQKNLLKDAGLPIVLGGVGMTLWDIAQLYTSVLHKGSVVPLSIIPPLSASQVKTIHLMSAQTAGQVQSILEGSPLPNTLLRNEAFQLGYKTGTSYGNRDAWCVGLLGPYLIAVWVGRVDGSPTPEMTGRLAALPLMFQIAQMVRSELSDSLIQKSMLENVSYTSSMIRFDRKKTAPKFIFPLNGSSVIKEKGVQLTARLNSDSGRHFIWYWDGQFIGQSAKSSIVLPEEVSGFHTLSVIVNGHQVLDTNFRMY